MGFPALGSGTAEPVSLPGRLTRFGRNGREARDGKFVNAAASGFCAGPGAISRGSLLLGGRMGERDAKTYDGHALACKPPE